MINIQKQIDYYNENRHVIDKDYSGKVIVISPDMKIKVYSSEEQGYMDSVASLGYGNFFMKNLMSASMTVQNIISPVITSE